ncbi:MAG: hypothetical protein HY885_04410 [Deltaproteobacteria bacterium]|nr:hypothetical protein [Deltaproteobacteria bacterium]
MTSYPRGKFFLPFLSTLCMFLASCIPQPVDTRSPKIIDNILVPEKQKIAVRTTHQPSERILTCLDSTLILPAKQIEEEFNRQKESFIAESSDEKRIRLICLALARLEDAESLEYAQELIKDMQRTDTAPYPDMKGLAALLDYFQQLQKKRITEVSKAQKQVNELKKQLEELKGIEGIIKKRTDDN